MLLIFCPYGRCGSTNLCDFLSRSCSLKSFNEPFNPTFSDEEHIKVQNCELDESISYLKNHFDLIKSVSIDLQEHQFQLINQANKILVLYRKFALDQIISVYMSTSFKSMSNKGIWHKHPCFSEKDMNEFYTCMRKPITDKFIKYEFDKINQDFITYKSHILDKSKNHMFVSYEDLFIEKTLPIEKILFFFDLSIKDPNYTNLLNISNKFNSIDTYKKVIPNFDHIYELREEFIINA